MANSMSKPERTHQSLSVELYTIWHVEADKSYDVMGSNLKRIIAIRTIFGSGTLVLKNEHTVALTENTLIFVRGEEIRRYYCNYEKWDFFWFEFFTDTAYLPEFDCVHEIKLTKRESTKLHECFNTLMSPMYFSANSASSYFSAILAFWISTAGISLSPNAAAIKRTLLHISENITKDILVTELARLAGMSERNFRNVFRQYTNSSPKKYIEDKRLNMAKELILSTNMQIKVIADSLGFSDQYYFSKAFKKKFGTAPMFYNGVKNKM